MCSRRLPSLHAQPFPRELSSSPAAPPPSPRLSSFAPFPHCVVAAFVVAADVVAAADVVFVVFVAAFVEGTLTSAFALDLCLVGS